MAERWQHERWIFAQFGPKLGVVGVRCTWDDPSAPSLPADPHPLLDGPLAATLGDVGLPVGPFSSPSDADLASVAPAASGKFADFLEARVLEFVLSRWGHADQTAGTENQMALGKLYAEIRKQLADKQKSNLAVHGPAHQDPGAPAATNGLRRGRFRLGR